MEGHTRAEAPAKKPGVQKEEMRNDKTNQNRSIILGCQGGREYTKVERGVDVFVLYCRTGLEAYELVGGKSTDDSHVQPQQPSNATHPAVLGKKQELHVELFSLTQRTQPLVYPQPSLKRESRSTPLPVDS